MTKPKIYDSSRGRARTFMRNYSKTNDVFAMTSLKGQTFKYFARSSDFPEGKRSMRLLCAFFKIIFLLFLFDWIWIPLFFPHVNSDLYSGLVAPGLSESLYVHTWYPNLNSTCAKYKVNLYVKFTGYLCVQDLQQTYINTTIEWRVYIKTFLENQKTIVKLVFIAEWYYRWWI